MYIINMLTHELHMFDGAFKLMPGDYQELMPAELNSRPLANAIRAGWVKVVETEAEARGEVPVIEKEAMKFEEPFKEVEITVEQVMEKAKEKLKGKKAEKAADPVETKK